jgi:thiosulfate reductase cytochrome b subunit
VQLQTVAALLGGYEAARRVHFFAMAGIVSFLGLHLVLVALVPHSLSGMVSGRVRVPLADPELMR